jgi:hypothetical protein
MRKKILKVLREEVFVCCKQKQPLKAKRKPASAIVKKCEMCGKNFRTKRRHKMTCSGKCRTKKSRTGTFMGVPIKQLVVPEIPQNLKEYLNGLSPTNV